MSTELIPVAKFTPGVVADARPTSRIHEPPAVAEDGRISPLAIAAAVCALLGFLNAAGFAAAIVLGHAARITIRRSGGRYRGRRLAGAALLVAWTPVVAVALTFGLMFAVGLNTMAQGH